MSDGRGSPPLDPDADRLPPGGARSRRAHRLRDVLAEVLAAPPPPVPAAALIELGAELDGAVGGLAADLPPEARPLRAPKDRITRVLACERHTLATLGPVEPAEPLVRGAALDHLVAHHLLGGEPEDPVAIAREALAVSGAGASLAWWDGAGDAAVVLEGRLRAAAGHLGSGWGEIESAWWARTQVDTSVVLAGGAVVCSARFDVVLGGPPTDRPVVIVEVKSGRARPAHRDDLLWYALLAGLASGHAPAMVVAWSAADDAVVPQPVSLGALEAAARRGVDAIARLAVLAGGVPATERGGPRCGWCPDLDRCATGRVELARRSADEDPERWSDEDDESAGDGSGDGSGDGGGW